MSGDQPEMHVPNQGKRLPAAVAFTSGRTRQTKRIFACLNVCLLSAAITACDSGNSPLLLNDPEYTTEASPLVEGLSIVTQWNELALAGVRNTENKPTVTAWRLFVLSVAMYDAAVAYTENSRPYALSAGLRRPTNEHTVENRRAAVSQAAYRTLTRMFPGYERANGYFRQYLEQLGYQPASGNQLEDGGIGYLAAEAAFLARSNDGSNYQNNFDPITSDTYPTPYEPGNSPDPISATGIFGADFDPNRWQPLRVPNGTKLDENAQAVVDDLNINSFGDQEFLSYHYQGQ